MAKADSVTLAELVRWCETHERVLRDQYPPERRLPVEAEAELASLAPETVEKAVSRLALLKHLYRVRHAEAEAASAPPSAEDAQAAARALLRREPVRLELGGHEVSLTGRSYAAMLQIARHDRRVRLLLADLAWISEELVSLADRLPALPPAERRPIRRRLRRYAALAGQVEREILHQRRALWAHALTPDGAPARGLDHLPEWWEKIDPIWDSALLVGLMEAGAGRYQRLGPAPEHKGRAAKEEDLGWGSLFATVERQHKLEPASLYDRDLFQQLAWLRAGADPVPEGMGS